MCSLGVLERTKEEFQGLVALWKFRGLEDNGRSSSPPHSPPHPCPLSLSLTLSRVQMIADQLVDGV